MAHEFTELEQQRGGQSGQRGASWSTVMRMVQDQDITPAAREQLVAMGMRISDPTWQAVVLASVLKKVVETGDHKGAAFLRDTADGKPPMTMASKVEHSFNFEILEDEEGY